MQGLQGWREGFVPLFDVVNDAIDRRRSPLARMPTSLNGCGVAGRPRPFLDRRAQTMPSRNFGHSQTELAELLDSRSRVGNSFAPTRVEVIHKIGAVWKIPVDLLKTNNRRQTG